MSIKTDNTATLVNALAEIERLRGRCAELESEIEFITGLSSKLTQAATLRKQAEAVEAAARALMPGPYGQPDDPSPEYTAACEMCSDFMDYANGLYQQAAELENNNGQK